MKCQKCGFNLDDKSTFCPYCGEKVEQENKKVCNNCGAELHDEDNFCQNCGSPINFEQASFNQENAEQEQKINKQKSIVEGIKKYLASNLSLAIVILTAVTLLLNFISNVSSSGIFSALISAILPALILIGMWKAYMHGKDSKNYPKTNLFGKNGQVKKRHFEELTL